ncbi:MAG: hypothetical protein ACTSYO_06230 [Candidatus Ranarchaeia archaeon]
MNPSEIVLQDELMVFLNHLEPPQRVTYPFMGVELFRLRLSPRGYEITDLVSPDQMVFEGVPEEVRDELPFYGDLVEALLHVGLIQYTNLEDFVKRHRQYQELKNICYSPDTNLFYHGFFSNTSIVGPRDVVVVSVVRDEIQEALNHKYRRSDLVGLKRYVHYHKELIDEFANRRRKRSRKAAYLAMRDYQAIRGKAYVHEVPTSGAVVFGGKDLAVIRGLKDYKQTHDATPILLTADDAMTDQCEIEAVDYWLFHYPHALKVDNCSPGRLCRLLMRLCGIFGCLQLGSAMLLGEFKGKRSPTEIKIEFLNPKLHPDIVRHLRLCRKLKKLPINR